MSLQADQFSVFKNRRNRLRKTLQKTYHKGLALFFADFEQERYSYRQESSFYYLTGVTEPGAILAMYLDGREVLYLPNFGDEREKWVNVTLRVSEQDNGESATAIGVSEIKYLGDQVRGYSLSSVFDKQAHRIFIDNFRGYISTQGPVLVLQSENTSLYDTQRERFHKIEEQVTDYIQTYDISYFVHEMRKTKDEHEMGLTQKAIDITCDAQRAVAQNMKPGLYEYQVRSILEQVFTYQGATRTSFPSIVATGKNTTVLHYTDLNHQLKDGDLVVVDIGAEYGYYAADITRTFPVSGTFTKRQREVYNAVLEAQAYIATVAKPGVYIRSAENPDKSLQHMTVKFLEEKGFAQYFVHGIGHFMGLDVHDVGDYSVPLRPGDVFTIEPGVYIPEENLGVRIEDDYVITENGCECLSKDLPKSADEIEAMMVNNAKAN